MKKLFLLLAAAGMIFTACENFGTEDSQQPYLEFDGGEELLSLDFPSDGMLGEVVTFSANYDWSVTTSDEWIKVTPDSGKAGDESQITISLDRNDTYDVRNGKITIYVQELSIEVPISQQPKNGLALSTTEVALPQSGGAFDITVLSNVDFEYEIKVDWIGPAETRALAENKVRFEAEANSTTDPRTGEIVFKGEGLTATLTVTQSQTNVVTLSTSTVEMEGEEGTFSVDVSANIDYEVAIEDGCDWISRVDSRSVTTSTLTFAVSKNETEAARSATISISGEDVEETITVNQGYIVSIPNNTIYYTSTDGKIVTPNKTDVFGANIVSNTYENGKGVITFDGDVTQIGQGAFVWCFSLTSITIPDSVTSIGMQAFFQCESLKSITIPDGVTSIGWSAFTGCPSLTAFYGKFASADNRCLIVDGALHSFAPAGITEYTIPDSVTSIGDSAFSYCTALTSVTIPNSVTAIGSGAFHKTSLTSVTIPDSITSIGELAFGGCSSLTAFYSKFASVDNRCLIVDGVLNSFAPAGLTEYTIPDVVTSIGRQVFQGYTSLTSVTIPDGVTSIGNLAFDCCRRLTSITIGNGVTSIGGNAFYMCTSLKDVYCKPTVPPTGGVNMFSDYNNGAYVPIGCKIYVPAASYDKYVEAENWNPYAEDIVAYDFEKGEIVENTNNQIIYTSTDGNIVEPKTDAVYGATIVSNTYENGVGVIAFDGDVTHIGTNAFENCATLVSITIPESVTVIGSGAFDNCTSLTSITIPDSVIAIGMHPFLNCTSLTAFYGKFASEDNLCLIIDGDLNSFAIGCGVTEYTIPDSVTGYIGVSAFASCSSLRSITIPNSVTPSISNGAFQNCSSLTSIIIPDSITGVGAEVFSGCTALTSVTIGNSVTLIGTSAFSGCTSLTSITIPNSVTRLGGSVFKDCTSLTSATIGNSVTSIYSHAFDNCTSLTSVTIPDSVTSIGFCAFENCTSLTSVTIGNGVTSIGGGAFHGCSSLTSIIIPDSVTSIGSAFYNCTSLTSVTIPDGVTVISGSTFQNCSSLASVTIPNGVTSIGMQAFLGCSSLTSITIPDSVTEMGRYAFYKCTSLKEVYCKPTTPPTGNLGIFNNNATDRKIYVPTASVSAYKVATYWSDYAASFVCYDFEKGEIDEVASKIIYTSTDGNIVTPYATDVFGANIVSNTYENGVGVITFDGVVASIGASAFRKCATLVSITIPDGVISIGEYAFRNCTSLTSVTIPDSVTSIGYYAFFGCGSLTSVTIPDGITSIREYTFGYCTSLTSITIPDSVTSIRPLAFANCTSLTAFYGKCASEDNRCLIVDGMLKAFAPVGLTSYTIPDSVTSIMQYAFSNCTSLTSVTIPDSVTSIGNCAFRGCTGELIINSKIVETDYTTTNFPMNNSSSWLYGSKFTKLTIGDNITKIGDYVFNNCTSLTSVTIGNGVTSIGEVAFYNCTSLTSVYCKSTTPPTGDIGMFSNNATDRKIYVPTASVDAYKAATYWKDYASYIVGYNF